MQEASFFMLISDMMAGMPVVYNTFFAYDEVAHHSGPHSQDAIKVLGKLDEGFARLESAAAMQPRPYAFVVLSDHGQSQGLPFEDRYGTIAARPRNRTGREGQRVTFVSSRIAPSRWATSRSPSNSCSPGTPARLAWPGARPDHSQRKMPSELRDTRTSALESPSKNDAEISWSWHPAISD